MEKAIVSKKKANFLLTFFLCWGTYSLAYFCRVNWSVSMPFLAEEFGWSNVSLGTVASGFFISYALGQLVNGIIGDKFNPKYFVAVGILGSAACNILISQYVNYNIILVLWTLNGFFQSMIWGPLVRTLSSVTPEKWQVTAGTLMSTSMVAGYFICYKVAGKVAQISWSKAFLIPGIVFVINAVVWLIFIDVDDSVIEKGGNPVEKSKEKGSFFKIFAGNGLIIIAVLCILHGIIKDSISTWSPTIIVDSLGIDIDAALGYLAFIPILNLAGILFSGWLCKRNPGSHLKNIGILFTIGGVFAVASRFVINSNVILTVMCLGLISASMFAINSIVLSIIPLSFAKNGRVSSVAGVLDFSAYVGSALSGPVIGLASDKGWAAVTLIWVGLVILALGILVIVKNKSKSDV